MKRTANHSFFLPLLAAVFTAALLLAGCDGGTGEFPPATEILRVEVEPNPVTAGDTAVFTCVIEDSLNSGFRFQWFLEGIEGAVTETNQYQWVAPAEPDTFSFQVEVDRLKSGFASVQQPFEVIVLENNQSNPTN